MAEEWERLKQLFNKALEFGPDKRAVFLAKANRPSFDRPPSERRQHSAVAPAASNRCVWQRYAACGVAGHGERLLLGRL